MATKRRRVLEFLRCLFYDLCRSVSASAHRRTSPSDARPIEALETRFHLSTVQLSSGIAANQAIAASSSVQQNPSIATDPLNPSHLVVSYMDYSLLSTGYAGIGVAVSENGGKTWTDTQIPLPANFNQGAATPVTQFDAQGDVFVSFSAATFLGTKPGLTDPSYSDRGAGDGFTSNNGIFVSESTDGGMIWGTPVAVASHLYNGTTLVDFDVTPDLGIDTFATLPDGKPNPYYDDLYEVWTRNYPAGLMPGNPSFDGGTDGMIAVSKDHGQTWTTEVNKEGITAIDDPVRNLSGVSPGLGYVDQMHVAIGPEGDVYVAEYGGSDFSVLFSDDGGQTFAAPDHNSPDRLAFGAGFNAYVNGTLDNDQFRTNSLRDIVADPTRSGVVYAVDVITNSSDQADVYFARSTDYGLTWSSKFNVGGVTASVLNDDAGLNDGHAMARLEVAPNGDLAVIWYDTRVDPANTSLNVFATVSTDGGLNWSANFRISDSTFDPNAGVFTDAAGQQDYYLGDFIGLSLTSTTAYATWTDTRTGNQQIELTSFSLNSIPAAFNDRFESNNTVAQATSLGTVFNDTVPQLDIPSGDTDWYNFTPAAAGQMSLQAIQPASASANLQLQLWDSTGTTLIATGADVTDGSGSVVGEKISASGTSGTNYLLRVVPIGDGTTYSLQLQGLTQSLGTQVYGQESNVLAAGQQNDYLINIAAAGTLNVQLTPGSEASGTFSLNVLSADGQTSLAAGTASGSDQTASLPVTAGESVLLQVAGNPTAVGSYGLSFSDLDQNTVAASSALIPAGTDPSQLAVGDLTGNSRQDIVVADAASNTVSVLLSNANGTFQAPREYTVGPFGSTARLTGGALPNFRRSIAIAYLQGPHKPADIVVTNYASGDISVLLGNGDGTFQPQRRFNAVADPFDLAVGDLTGNGNQDIVVVSANSSPGTNLLQETVGVLLGRGDGTFLPPRTFTIDLPSSDEYPFSSVKIADINGDGIPDLALSGTSDGDIRIFYGSGNGTFTPGPVITNSAQEGTALAVANLSGKKNPQIISASLNTGALYVYQANSDGKFTTFPSLGYSISAGPIALAIGDVGSASSTIGELGEPGGEPNLIVASSGETFGLPNSGGPGVSLLPGTFSSDGTFQGFDAPVQIYSGIAPLDVAVGDFAGNGVSDIAVLDTDGVHIIYGGTPTVVPNDTPQTALDLGTVTHVAEPTLSILPGQEDAYFDLTAPTEADSAAGDEVLDFSGLFQHQIGAGLSMQLLNSAGQVLASGERFRVVVPQGEALTLHVAGASADSAGAYTLDIDALPQVVSVAAQPLASGGPTSSLVITFQGERLDSAAAENPANYQVIWLGTNGTSTGQTIPLGSGQSVVYDPGANIDVSSGAAYPTAVKQTVTLLFDEALPAGSYEIRISPNLVSTSLTPNENSLLADTSSVGGHELVSVVNGSLVSGAKVVVADLVAAVGSAQSLSTPAKGTALLTQLHSDLNAILDSELSHGTGDNAVTQALIQQLLQRIEPDLRAAGLPPLLLLFLDPVSLNLADPSGQHISYNLQTDKVSNPASDAFVSVTGNVEVLVMPAVTGSYNLDVADVPATARGGVALVDGDTQQTLALTDAMRAGQQDFTFGLPSNSDPGQLLVAYNQAQAVVPTETSTTDQQSDQSETPPVSSETTSASPAAQQPTVPAPSDDAVTRSDGSTTVDAQDQANERKNKRRRHTGDESAPAPQQKQPTSKPVQAVRPPAGVAAAEPAARPASIQLAGVQAGTSNRIPARIAAAVQNKNPAVAPARSPAITRVTTASIAGPRTHRLGAIAVAFLCASVLFQMIEGRKKTQQPTRRRRF